MPYQLEIRHQLEPFFDEPRLWDFLSGGVAFREIAWLAPWWRHLGRGNRAFLVVVRNSSKHICGLLPLYQRPNGSGRVLAMMGDGEACTDYASVLSRPEEAEQVGEAIGKYLTEIASDSLNGWDTIEIDGIVEGDVGMAAVARGLKAGQATLHTVSRMRTWFKPSDENWQEHLKHYSKTTRRRMRRTVEKIGPGKKFEECVAKTESDVDEYLGALIDMHQRRWESVGKPGSYANPDFRNFIFEAAKSFLNQDRLHLNLLRHEGRNLAAELNLIGENRIMYCYSAGFDIEAAELEPGRLANVATLQELYRSNLAGIDFMRGDETYKSRLATSSRRVLRMRATAPNLIPRLRHAAWCTGFEVKQWMRKKTGKSPLETFDLGLSVDAGSASVSSSV
ncbi:MAG: GNAT family N-acetyltransferase [Rubripirellula sp.]|nr:GNAT family N-acetyltransferase [Rubripirellula sp.]